MMWGLVQNQYCYDYLISQIPFGLLLYSHIPTALIALIFGGYVLYKDRRLPSAMLFVVCAAFAGWSFFDLASWFAFLGPERMMFAWSLLDLLALVFFAAAYYFLYAFLKEQDLPLWQKLVGAALILPTAVTTFLGQNLVLYDANICEAWEDSTITLYPYFVEGIVLLGVLALAFTEYRRATTQRHRRESLFAGLGVFLFLGFFFSATLGVALLVDYDIGEYAYNYEIYGLFGMPVLLIYLGYLIVRYKAFDLRIFGAQALILALLALIASEFTFVQSFTNRMLVLMTLIMTAFIGVMLIRSVRREIEQREHIEALAANLDKSNKQQVILIHFITHQIKGFVTKSRNIFSVLLDGDMGKVPDTIRPMLEEGLRSDTKGINTIQDILSAANISSGKVAYVKAEFDVAALIQEIAGDLKTAADAKGLAFSVDTGTEPVMISGDRAQLTNAFKNLIDNSIKYTPSGEVRVSLKKEDEKMRFTIEDTGVGITDEDMEHLFTEGGHGKNSTSINVESTGYGLYIVKNIIEAHEGKVWAESEGEGKGSRFIVELPA